MARAGAVGRPEVDLKDPAVTPLLTLQHGASSDRTSLRVRGREGACQGFPVPAQRKLHPRAFLALLQRHHVDGVRVRTAHGGRVVVPFTLRRLYRSTVL